MTSVAFPAPGVQPVRYVFIDGAAVRAWATEHLGPYFDHPLALSAENLRNIAGSARRVFYYDCLPAQSDNGADAPLKTLADAFQACDGCFVRFGALRGSKNKRQKKVDVMLSIEALSHAIHRNMDTAVLVAGDLDFEPVVSELVRLGTRVEVYCHEKHVARELAEAADRFVAVSSMMLFDLCTAEFKLRHPFVYKTDPPRDGEIKCFVVADEEWRIVKRKNGGYAIGKETNQPFYASKHWDTLVQYVELEVSRSVASGARNAHASW